MNTKKYQVILFLFIFLWCLGLISPTIFYKEKAFLIIKPFLTQVYSTVCHQVDEKTIYIAENNFLVCSRCSGIYLGTFIASLISILIVTRRTAFDFLFWASLLMLFDVLLSSIGVYGYSKLFALLTGSLFGFTIFLFLLNEIKYFKSLSSNEK